jgi:hypothetical protein
MRKSVSCEYYEIEATKPMTTKDDYEDTGREKEETKTIDRPEQLDTNGMTNL